MCVYVHLHKVYTVHTRSSISATVSDTGAQPALLIRAAAQLGARHAAAASTLIALSADVAIAASHTVSFGRVAALSSSGITGACCVTLV
jgi:hypothetical protein